jgi:hypothetical protein
MRILFFGRYDWANISHRVARAINAGGIVSQARVLVERAHPLGYEEDMVVEKGTHREFLMNLQRADWIISTGDATYDYFMSMISLLSPRARLAVCHVGTAYRDAHELCNDTDAKLGFDRRFIGGDLYRFAKDDPAAIPYFAPPHGVTNLIAAALPPVGERLRIGHSPGKGSEVAKGTAEIVEVLAALVEKGLPIDFEIITGVSFEECVRRRAACHIFIDQMNPVIGGFGASAVEAMAAGCAVLADVRNVVGEVDRFYPRPPIMDVCDGYSLEATVRRLVEDRRLLDTVRARSIGWVREHASQEAIARYWLKHLS